MKANQGNMYIQSHNGKDASATPASVNAHSEEQAVLLFRQATDKLLDVNHWSAICGPLCPIFRLTDTQGVPLGGKAIPGNYIRIDIPDTGAAEGKIAELVRIEKIEHHSISEIYELFVMQVRPSSERPGSRDFFLKEDSAPSLVIERDRQYVNATVYGGGSGVFRLPWHSLARALLA